ncbi:cobaltochelatase subunit CobT, partial [Azospirillum brasilense]|nr:cobaltochelatase subunit CobT [Azospirillum brasilense]
MTDRENPVEAFKRSTAAAVRALSRRADVQVGFSTEPPGVAGLRVRIPTPARDLNPHDVATLRGAADAVSLRLRFHDNAIHLQRMPLGDSARAAYDALEQARCEALGASHMPGVAANLEAALDERYHKQGFERLEDREQVPLPEGRRRIAPVAMSGAAPPPAPQDPGRPCGGRDRERCVADG